VWFSDQYGRDLTNPKLNKSFNTQSLLKTSWDLLYSSTFTNNMGLSGFRSTTLLGNQSSFNSLSFYEASFHFFLLRLKFFSNLQSNKITSSYQPHSSPVIDKTR
jgi:hypothetical protein